MLKKYVSLVLALSLLTSCAAPAGPSPEPSSAASPSGEILTEEEGAEELIRVILDSQSNGESYHPLSAEDTEFYLSEVYGIPGDSRGGAALIYTLGGVEAGEIAVLYGTTSIQSNTAAAALERYRKNRLADFSGYVPDQAALVEKGLVLEGNAALLVICADPDAAQKALEDELSYLALKPYDPDEEPPEPYDWTKEVNEKGWRLFDPPGKFDMTPYDTTAIREAWAAGDPSGLSDKDAAIYARCQEILPLCVEEGMTDFRKESNLYCWLTQTYYGDYDRSVNDPTTPLGREDNLTPYGLLVRGYGICLAYATTFQLLMDLAGVECITVVGASSSSSGDHAWNMVKLEGEWYCVDPTWDASYHGYLQGEELMVSTHRYFNVTSDYMRQTDHQWDYENIPEATATRFRWDGKGQPSA